MVNICLKVALHTSSQFYFFKFLETLLGKFMATKKYMDTVKKCYV